MPIRLDAWTDFTCPHCFLATLTLEKLCAETPVDLRWRSFQLHASGAAPLLPEARSMVEKEHVRLAERARAQLGLQLHPGPIGISTRDAHIANKFADSQKKGDAFHSAAMRAYWMEGRSLQDRKVLQEIAEKSGLDRADLNAAWENRSYAAYVDADLMQAATREITGVPAVVFAGKYILAGAQSLGVFKKVLDQVQQEELRHPKRAQAGD